MPYTQENRLISIDTPLGDNVLLLEGFTGHEGISRLFNFQLNLLSENDSISFTDIVGKSVTIAVNTAGDPRYFNGVISRFALTGKESGLTRYQAEMVPWLWMLTRYADCRIFQNMAIPDIIEKVFTGRGFTDYRRQLQNTYNPVEYCVQYRETDFNFVSRLMEQCGICYFFEHEDGKHTLVLGDAPSVHQPCPGQATASFNLTAGDLEQEDVITVFHTEQVVQTGKYSLTDYNFETPSTSLLASEPTIVSVGGNSGFEMYDYPGDYLKKPDGQSLAKIRMQEEEVNCTISTGTSVCRAFTSGYKFELADCYRDDLNTSYLLTEVQHTASVGGSFTTGGAGGGYHYSNRFTCIPATVPFRPPRATPKPFVQGPQTALVVGNSGEEILVDRYGRIKVQFYWDRIGKKDENSGCWIRVSQPWAGKNWGAMWIPRIGQEVVVSFLEGDPDRPLITGRVYNAEQMPPYELPANQTRSTFMSRSSKGGGTANYNELRFEDKKGSEQIFLNAEMDMDHRVEHDSREYVGNNRHLIVHVNQQELVEGDKHGHVKGTHFEKIEGDMSLQVSGKQMEKTGGDQSLEVDGAQKEKIVGDVSLKVGGDQNGQVGGSVSLQVGQSRNEKVGQTHALEAGQTIHLKGGMTVIIEAGMQLSLKGPGGFVDIGPAGVTIQGTMVLINSGGAAGSGPGASPQSPQDPDAPKDPKDPDTADDGSKGGKLNK
ncbi:MAG TPA: type VI secretion system tip protein TssI/VgrG [Terriglobia bacterium]|nr:type VI secretion system tip protein TssI/VgrG [Terriglobia bacterium]